MHLNFTCRFSRYEYHPNYYWFFVVPLVTAFILDVILRRVLKLFTNDIYKFMDNVLSLGHDELSQAFLNLNDKRQ